MMRRAAYSVVSFMVVAHLACSANDAPAEQPDGSAAGVDAAGDAEVVTDGGGEVVTDGGDAEVADVGVGEDGQVPQPFWANTHIDYTGGGVNEIVDFNDCYFCDASDAVTHTLVRYQQDQGYTIWALYIPDGTTTGVHSLSTDYSGFYATLSANDAGLPTAARGFYAGNVNVGNVTLTQVDLTSGGAVEGTIDVRWTKDGVTAHMVSTFHADLP